MQATGRTRNPPSRARQGRKQMTDLHAREFSQEERARLASQGKALPDGSYPIVTREDLENAIQAIGRASDPAAAEAHIKKRARALGLEELIPEEWGDRKSFV